MNLNVARTVIGQLAHHPRDFLAGWIEGRLRYERAPGPNAVPASRLPRGSIGHAASDAAVAFHQALDDGA